MLVVVYALFVVGVWCVDPLARPGASSPGAAMEPFTVIGAIVMFGVVWVACWFSAFSDSD